MSLLLRQAETILIGSNMALFGVKAPGQRNSPFRFFKWSFWPLYEVIVLGNSSEAIIVVFLG